MCVHDRVCSSGVWQIAHGSPLCRGGFLGTWMTLGKAGTRGAFTSPGCAWGRAAGMHGVCDVGPKPATAAAVWGSGVFVTVVL